MKPRHAIAGFLVAFVAVVGLVIVVNGPQAAPSLALASSTGQLEAARKADTAAASAVKAAEASLTAARATKVATAEALAALEVEAPKEPPVEEPATGATVNAVPAGPASPSGTWSVAYADGFGAPLSTDQTWAALTHDQGCCGNSNEIASERPSKVLQSAKGLEVLCSREVTVTGKPFTCGGVRTPSFAWKPGLGQTVVFEAVLQLPPRDEGEDPGWWSTDTPWTDEFDYFEGWEWGHLEYYGGLPVWKAKTPNTVEIDHEAYKLLSEIPEPETRLHTYTTVVKANNEVEEWIDGKHRWNIGPPSSLNTPWMHLLLTHALRVSSKLAGTNSFTVRSVAVYEDSAHAGVGIEHGGIAPGTVVR